MGDEPEDIQSQHRSFLHSPPTRIATNKVVYRSKIWVLLFHTLLMQKAH